jgi:hypothetical protein
LGQASLCREAAPVTPVRLERFADPDRAAPGNSLSVDPRRLRRIEHHAGMPPADSVEPGRLNIGDHVVALTDITGVWKPQIRQGTAGEVVDRSPDGMLIVQFDGHRTERVDRVRLAAQAPRTQADPPMPRRWNRRGWRRRHR